MMSKRIAVLLSVAAMLFSLSGCQLAVPGKGTSANPDALRGMFIMFESSYSDSDMDVLPDDMFAKTLVNAGTVPMGNSEGNRTYATIQEDEHGGLKYVFEGIEGIPMFTALIHGNDTHEDYWASCYDNALLDVNTTVGGTDSGSSVQIDATLSLYLNPEFYDEYGQCILYLNPVYQNSEGEVYMLPGSGYGLGGWNEDDGKVIMSVGNLGTLTISGSTTMKNGQKEEHWSGEFSVTVMGVGDIKRYVLKEMDTTDRLIVSTEITKGSIPETLTLNDKTAYAILEEYSAGKDGGTHINRSLVDMSAEFFAVRFPDEKGFARQTLVTLNNRFQ